MSNSAQEIPVQLMVDHSGHVVYVVENKNKSEATTVDEAMVTSVENATVVKSVEEAADNMMNSGKPRADNVLVEQSVEDGFEKTNDSSDELNTVSSDVTEPDEGDVSGELLKETDTSKPSAPITVSEETEVIIDGQKCVLRVNPINGMLSAYPIKAKQTVSVSFASQHQLETPSTSQSIVTPIGNQQQPPESVDLDSSAAEGLLELSNAGTEGRQEDDAEQSAGLSRPSGKSASVVSVPIPRFIIPSPGGKTTLMAIMHKKVAPPGGISLMNMGQPEASEEDGSASTTADDKQSVSLLSPASAPSIQIPPSLAPFVLPKKAPVKIGLKTSDEDLAKFRCSKCDFQGYYEKQYQSHIATHTEFTKKCKCCAYLTFDDQDLLEHYKSVHPKNICSICDMTAEHAYIIKRHEIRHNSKGCECDICGKVYKDRYILKMHVKLVHMPAEILYACHICQKKFTRKAHLKRHTRIHEPEKPFKCPHCDYRGCERSDISKHILIHEEPQHACEMCGKAFRHIKNKELHVKRHKGQRDYKCGVCDFYGYTFTDIRKHIERKHGEREVKTLICERCSMTFKSETAYVEHRKHCDLMFGGSTFVSHTDSLHLEGGRDAIEIPSSQIETGSVTNFAIAGNHLIRVDDSEMSLDEPNIPTSMADCGESGPGGQQSMTSHGELIQESAIDGVALEISHDSEIGSANQDGSMEVINIGGICSQP